MNSFEPRGRLGTRPFRIAAADYTALSSLRQDVAWSPLPTDVVGSLTVVAHSSPYRDAFATIAAENTAMLQRLALRLTGNSEAAQDLVQDTLLRAFLHVNQRQPGANPAAWLCTILTRRYYDQQLKQPKVELKAAPELAPLETTTGESTLRAITDADLYAAIRVLEPELREVVERGRTLLSPADAIP